MNEQHEWGRDGERCVKCGDKDWMGGECNGAAPSDAAAVVAQTPPKRNRVRPLTAELRAWQAEREALLARIAELERRWWHRVLAWWSK